MTDQDRLEDVSQISTSQGSHAAKTVIDKIDGFSARGPVDAPIDSARSDEIVRALSGLSETMLWSLHNRASEARRPDGVFIDIDSVRIHEAIEYDFAGHFGDPAGSLAVRAAEIDRALRRWLQRHPDGCVVSLGEGLETQVRRVDNGRVRWLSVDLPDAIRLRECFLAPTDRFRHIALSALHPAWMDEVDPSSGLFIIAQGLLMYIDPELVHQLISTIADRFPEAEMVFDVVPRWFSRLTLQGQRQTPNYFLPPMPWGINRDELEPTLRRWWPNIASIMFLHYEVPRGLAMFMSQMIKHIPILRHEVPTLVHVIQKRPTHSTYMSNHASTSAQSPALTSKSEEAAVPGIKQPMPHEERGDDRRKPLQPGGPFSMATRNASAGSDFIIAASQVIARRTALGVAAILNPLRADHVELARIVPEKVEAFSTAGMIALKRSVLMRQQMAHFASDQSMTAAKATIAMTGCSSPGAMAEIQGQFARAWFDRAASNFITIGMLTLGAQDAIMTPIRQTVVANAERLSR